MHSLLARGTGYDCFTFVGRYDYGSFLTFIFTINFIILFFRSHPLHSQRWRRPWLYSKYKKFTFSCCEIFQSSQSFINRNGSVTCPGSMLRCLFTQWIDACVRSDILGRGHSFTWFWHHEESHVAE